MEFVTCPIYDSEVKFVPNETMKYYDCKCLSIDHTKEYKNYKEWPEKYKIPIEKMKTYISQHKSK